MIAEQGRVPNRYSQTLVYLDKNKDHEICGYLEHPAEDRLWRFDDTVTFIALHEMIFGQANYPQSSYELRAMDTRERGTKDMADKTIEKKQAELNDKPTFIINVQYRQNTTWQGTIKWVEGDIEKRFRSTLELIKLMDSAVGGEDTPWQ